MKGESDLKILAIDTSSFPASVAISDDNVILGEYVIRNQRKHSQNIMVMVERLFADLSMDISEIDIFATTCGPGSFTGLRIGISTVRAFAQAMKKPVVSVNTLEAIAYNMSTYDGIVIPMLDARRDEVFTAVYKFSDNESKELCPPSVMTISEIIEKYKNQSVMFCGDGALIHKSELDISENFRFAPVNLSETRASAVIAVAHSKALRGEVISYNEVEPIYLRKSQAEQEYERKQEK